MPYKLLPETPKENMIGVESLHRLPAQVVTGAAAVVPGIFGDVASIPYAGINALTTALGGKDVPYEQSPLGKVLPTTAQHAQNLQSAIPYLKPKNKLEKFVNEVSSDTVSLFLPGGALRSVGLRGTTALRSFATSLGANAAGEAVKDLTGDPKKAAYTKMGIMFFGSLLNKPGINREINNLYHRSDQLLPQNATTNANRLHGELTQLQNRILVGRQPADLAPSERFVIDQSDVILRQIQNGQINVGTLRAALRSLNENLQRFVFEAPNRGARVGARRLALNINHAVNRTLEDYGRTNPEWWQSFRSAQEATATLHQSNFATRFIENNIVGHPLVHGLLGAFGVGLDVATGILPYQMTKILYRIYNSPTLRNHYTRVVSSAAAENAPLMNKEIKKLDAGLQKEQKKQKYRLLD